MSKNEKIKSKCPKCNCDIEIEVETKKVPPKSKRESSREDVKMNLND